MTYFSNKSMWKRSALFLFSLIAVHKIRIEKSYLRLDIITLQGIWTPSLDPNCDIRVSIEYRKPGK